MTTRQTPHTLPAILLLSASTSLAQISEIPAFTNPASRIDMDALPLGPVTLAQINAAGTSGSASLAAITLPDKPTAGPGLYNANAAFGAALARVNGIMSIIDNSGNATFDATTFTFDLAIPHTQFGVGVGDWNGLLYLEFYSGTTFIGSRYSSAISATRPTVFFQSTQPFDRVTVDVETAAGNFVIHELWTEPLPAGCYPNCDNSTSPPILNVDDFTCFINNYAAATALPHAQQLTAYANCDDSTTAPVLNVDDFTCFINAFAQGCP